MNKWVLIITVWVGMSQGGVAVQHIEFNTRDACVKAGNAYLEEMKMSWPDASALCVSKDSEK